MFFYILDASIFLQVEGVDAIMLRGVAGFVVYSATGNDKHIGVVTNIEVVIHKVV